MQNSPIQIGSIDLQDFEIPQSLRFGGRQRVVVHPLAGGGRVVERLGAEDTDIRFRGTFSGVAAETRARSLDNLRMSGQIVWLTWGSYRRQVVVKNFIADYCTPWWIAYELSCIVVYQNPEGLVQLTNVAVLVSADMSNALSAASGTDISLTSLQTALSAPDATIYGTTSQATAIEAGSALLDSLTAQINDQSALLALPAPADATPTGLAALYEWRVRNAGSLAATVNVRSYVGRITSTISD